MDVHNRKLILISTLVLASVITAGCAAPAHNPMPNTASPSPCVGLLQQMPIRETNILELINFLQENPIEAQKDDFETNRAYNNIRVSNELREVLKKFFGNSESNRIAFTLSVYKTAIAYDAKNRIFIFQHFDIF